MSSGSDDDERSHRHHKKRKEKHRHHKHHKEKIHKKEDHRPTKPATIWIDEAGGLAPSDAYRIDHKSDVSNLGYDSLYSGDTANYRRWFGDVCVGLRQGDTFKFTDSRNRIFKKRKVEVNIRYHRQVVAQNSQDALLHFTTDKSKRGTDKYLTADVLPLTTEEKEEKASPSVEISPESYISKHTSHYQQQLADNPHDTDLWLKFIAFQDEALVWGKPPGLFSGDESGSSSNVRHKHRLAVLERKVAIFERALESNPLSVELLVGHMTLAGEIWETERLVKRWKDIVFKQPNKSLLWLRYIEFCQSRFSFFRLSTLRTLYCKAISTLVAIIDRSLVSHRPEPDAEKHLLAIFLLYCYFLRQSGHAERSVACLQALVEFTMCCPVELLDNSCKERKTYFEAYWDSGSCHVGEEGAAGWRAWWEGRKQGFSATPLGQHQCPGAEIDVEVVKQEKEDEEEEEEEEEKEDKEEKEDEELQLVRVPTLSEAWIRLESHRDVVHCFPAKDEDEDDAGLDPERVVLFDDIASCLFILRDTKLQHTLLVEFLRFLGAPVLSPSFLLSVFPHLSNIIISPQEILHPSLSLTAVSYPLLRHHQPLSLGDEDKAFQTTVHGLLCSYSPSAPSLSSSVSSSPQVRQFTSNLFNQSLSLYPLGDARSPLSSLAESWLLYEFNILQQVKDGQSSIRAQKLHSLSISLLSEGWLTDHKFVWWFIAQLEQELDLKRKPSKLSKQYLQQYTSTPLSQDAKQALSLHCQFFVECVLGLRPAMACYRRHKDNRELAMYALVLLSEDGFNPTMLPVSVPTVSPARLLRSGSALRQNALHSVKSLCDSADFSHSLSLVACHGYYQYVLNDLETSCVALREVEQSLEEQLCGEERPPHCASILEPIYILHTQLILHHSQHYPIKPHFLREILQRALKFFPDHCWLLQAYIESEQHSFISGDLRRFFSSHAPQSVNASLWFLTVLSEVQRYHRLSQLVAGGERVDEPASGLLHRVRAILVRACQADNGHLCPALWRLNMKFEVSSVVV